MSHSIATITIEPPLSIAPKNTLKMEIEPIDFRPLSTNKSKPAKQVLTTNIGDRIGQMSLSNPINTHPKKLPVLNQLNALRASSLVRPDYSCK